MRNRLYWLCQLGRIAALYAAFYHFTLVPLYSQGLSSQGGVPLSGSGAPSNPCAQANSTYINSLNGDFYTCPSTGGNWVKWPTAGATSAAGSAGQLQIAGAAGAFAATVNYSYVSHTLAGDASAIFDMHLAATTAVLLPGGLSSGLVRVTTTTGATSSAELSGDCTTSGSNVIACTKTGGTLFATSATVDTTQGGNITGGLIGLAVGGAHANLSGTGGAHFVLQQSTAGGNVSVARLACADLSDAVASCSTNTVSATNITTGTLPAAQLPNPSASTLGGIQSIASSSHLWVDSISTSGVPHQSQVSFSDLSSSIAIGQISQLATNNAILIRDNTGALNQLTAASIGIGNCIGANGSPLQFTGLSCGGGSGGTGFNGVNAKTSGYTLLTADAGKLVTVNGSSLTLTLPAAAPSATWSAGFLNLNATPATVSRNSLLINGTAADITLLQYQTAYAFTDGTNYFLLNRPLSAGSGITLSESATAEQIGIQSTFVPTITNLLEGNNTTLIDAGTTTAYVASPSAGCSNFVLTSGAIVWVVPNTSSLTSASLTACSQALKNIKQIDGVTDPGTTITAGQPFPAYYDGSVWRDLFSGVSGGSPGTVTSVGFTGGLITVASATTTPAFTVAGTSGGVPYFSSASTWASSGALASGQFVLGGGAGAAPTTSFSIVPSANGGTGVNNGSSTITLAGNLITTGAFNTTFAQAASTTVTLPSTSSTMARTDSAQTFTGVQTFSTPIALTSLASTVVNASAPGAGVAHFAGSTQTVTSSLIVNADITASTIDLTTKVTGVLPTANIALALANQTSIHGLSISSSTGTLAIANLKTVTVSNTLTFTGTDSSSIAFGAGGTVLYSGGALGTPTSGTATNLTGLPISTGVSGLGTNVATFLATPSGANFNAMIASGGIPIPLNSKSAAYTTVLADGGGQIYHPSADTTARIWTIDSNANVAYPVGTTLTFVNDTSAGTLTISITTDTLVLAGAGTTGSRTLAAGGIATALKVTSTRWIINGVGLT